MRLSAIALALEGGLALSEIRRGRAPQPFCAVAGCAGPGGGAGCTGLRTSRVAGRGAMGSGGGGHDTGGGFFFLFHPPFFFRLFSRCIWFRLCAGVVFLSSSSARFSTGSSIDSSPSHSSRRVLVESPPSSRRVSAEFSSSLRRVLRRVLRRLTLVLSHRRVGRDTRR